MCGIGLCAPASKSQRKTEIAADDVRSRRVYLTQRGAATIPVIRDAVNELEREWETRLGPADWQQLKRLLIELNAALA